jgi:diphthamide synthase subunit DPH2
MVGKLYHQKKGIIDVIENLNYDQIKFTANEDLIHYIDTVDEALSNRLLKTQVLVLADAKKRTEYSFTSCTVLYKISSRYFIASGLFTSTYCREQRVPNGDFLR